MSGHFAQKRSETVWAETVWESQKRSGRGAETLAQKRSETVRQIQNAQNRPPRIESVAWRPLQRSWEPLGRLLETLGAHFGFGRHAIWVTAKGVGRPPKDSECLRRPGTLKKALQKGPGRPWKAGSGKHNWYGEAKTLILGFYLYTSMQGPRKGAGSRSAFPALHDILCRSRSSGSFGLRVAVGEPSAKTLGFRGRV